MQGLESLNQFQKFVSSLGGLGRYGDTYMIHAEEGETVVPMEVLDRNPVLKKRLFKSMKALGIDPGRYIDGNNLNSLNPLTGQPEFFFKRLKKALGDISGYAAPIVGAMYGPAAGAMVGAGLGAFKRENPGDPSQWAQMAGLGGLSGLAANVAGGQNWLTGTGLQHGTGTWNPWKIGKHYLTPGEGKTPWSDYFTKPSGEYESSILEKAFGSSDDVKLTSKLEEAYSTAVTAGEWEDAANIQKVLEGTKKGVPMKEIVGTGLLLGLLEKYTTKDEDVGDKYVYEPTGDIYENILNPIPVAEGGIIGYHGGGFTGSPHTEGPFYTGEDEGSAPDIPGLPYDDMMKNMMMKYLQEEFMNNPSDFEQKYGNDTAEFIRQTMGLRTKEQLEKDTGAIFDPESSEIIGYNLNKGGIMDLQGGGESRGPGTGTSDSIPAMLSDGEFVMTADAVRGAGGGDRREGARKMYEAMDRLEARV